MVKVDGKLKEVEGGGGGGGVPELRPKAGGTEGEKGVGEVPEEVMNCLRDCACWA